MKDKLASLKGENKREKYLLVPKSVRRNLFRIIFGIWNGTLGFEKFQMRHDHLIPSPPAPKIQAVFTYPFFYYTTGLLSK